MSIRQVVYVSSGCREYTGAELDEIAATGSRNNAAAAVTGILLYYYGNFMQLIEGAPEAVEKTFRRISDDNRHTGILKLHDSLVEERWFPDHSLGFRAVADNEMTSFPDLFEKRDDGWNVNPQAQIDDKLAVLFHTFFSINSGRNA